MLASSSFPVVQSSTDPALNASASSAAAFYELASDLLRHGQPQMAVDYCRLAIQAQPTAQGYKLLGDSLQNLKQFSEAESAYRQALQLAPDGAEIYANLGTLYVRQQQWLKALDCYQRALKLKPQLTEIRGRLEQIWVEIQAAGVTVQDSTAQSAVQAMAQPAVQTSEAAYQAYNRGNGCLQHQQWQEAVQHYQQAIELDPHFAMAHWRLAQGLEAAGEREQAIEHYFLALSLQPDLAKPAELCKFGEMFGEQDRPERALSCYEWALQQDEALAEAQFRVGELRSGQQEYEAAIVRYRRAVDLQPKAEVYHALGDALTQLQRWQEAVEAYSRAIELNPEFSWSHNNLGDVLMQLRQWEAAAKAYEQAIELNPEFHWSHYNLGEALVKLERWDAAITVYQRILKDHSGCSDAAQKLSYAVRQRAKAEPNNALSYYRQAIEHDPDNPELFHGLIELEPQNIDWYVGLVQALVRQKQVEQAAVVYQMALQLQPELAETAPTLQDFLVTQQSFQARRTPQDLSQLSDLQTVADIIEQSGLFDQNYYLRQYKYEVMQEMSPLQHYIQIGAQKGHHPNPFFNGCYYLEQNPDVARAGINPLAHYLYCGAAEGRDPHPLFKTAFYLAQHPDISISEINPLAHYLLYGLIEGRVALSVNSVMSGIDQVERSNAKYLSCIRSPASKLPARLKAKVGIYCNSLGNYFMMEIADFIAAAFERVGIVVLRLCETDSRPDDLDFDLIVAPHEFFYLGAGELWQTAPWLADAMMVNVEQPHTSWFAKAFHFLRQARMVFDINVKSAVVLEQLGLDAYFLPLGYLPNYEPFGFCSQLPDLLALRGVPKAVRNTIPDLDAPLETRPIDLHFVGTLNSRREQFFAESAAWLSRFHCFLHIPPTEGPLIKGKDQALDTEAVIGLSQRSKILLNIHREDLPYFEWHRIVFHGLWQKTLVVTEPCHEVPGLMAGEHFVECRLGEMGGMVDWLLNTPTGRAEAERIRLAGHQALIELGSQRIMQNVLQLWIGASAMAGGKQ